MHNYGIHRGKIEMARNQYVFRPGWWTIRMMPLIREIVNKTNDCRQARFLSVRMMTFVVKIAFNSSVVQ